MKRKAMKEDIQFIKNKIKKKNIQNWKDKT